MALPLLRTAVVCDVTLGVFCIVIVGSDDDDSALSRRTDNPAPYPMAMDSMEDATNADRTNVVDRTKGKLGNNFGNSKGNNASLSSIVVCGLDKTEVDTKDTADSLGRPSSYTRPPTASANPPACGVTTGGDPLSPIPILVVSATEATVVEAGSPSRRPMSCVTNQTVRPLSSPLIRPSTLTDHCSRTAGDGPAWGILLLSSASSLLALANKVWYRCWSSVSLRFIHNCGVQVHNWDQNVTVAGPSPTVNLGILSSNAQS